MTITRMTGEAHEALDNFLEMYGDVERAHEAVSRLLARDLVEPKGFHDLIHAIALYVMALSDLQEDLGF